ncbi:transposase, partial [Bradyrhizobium liaoningense]|uniref:transposase n=1 Tax=Bradyrhizobium liaoningense TaxID=43992 RepID=UPI002012DA57
PRVVKSTRESRSSRPPKRGGVVVPLSNNPLERIMKEIRRRTRVVGAFPDGQSCLNLAAARLRHIAGTAWSTKCYMNMRPLYQPQLSETGAVA